MTDQHWQDVTSVNRYRGVISFNLVTPLLFCDVAIIAQTHMWLLASRSLRIEFGVTMSLK